MAAVRIAMRIMIPVTSSRKSKEPYERSKEEHERKMLAERSENVSFAWDVETGYIYCKFATVFTLVPVYL